MTERKISQLAGKVLAGRYELVKVIGDGGMGRVYRGVQLSTGGRVAIKIMDAWDHDAATVKRFRYEAETTASLSHPNTVRILDFGSDDDLFFLVMEYLPGTDLTRYLRREGQSDPFVAHVLLQTACSLAEAHSRGVVHRDIKPNNIMLLHHAGLPSFVKVIDFGIARAIGGPGNGTVGVLGTMGYIAPEQMKDGVQLDARTDLYSLGCVAYELLSGRLPFDGITHNSPPMDVLEAHLRGNPTPLSKARPGVNPRLAELIMGLIRKRPDDRPPAAGELIEPLYELRRELSPELASSYDRAGEGGGAEVEGAAVEVPDSDEPMPAGTAAYGIGMLDDDLPPVPEPPPRVGEREPEAPPPRAAIDSTPFGRPEEEDDEDVISSAAPMRRGAGQGAGASVTADPEPEGEDEATAGRTVRVSRPPVADSEGPEGAAPEATAPDPAPASDPPPSAAAALGPAALAADPSSVSDWGFAGDGPPSTERIDKPTSPATGRLFVMLVIGAALGMAAMWLIQQ